MKDNSILKWSLLAFSLASGNSSRSPHGSDTSGGGGGRGLVGLEERFAIQTPDFRYNELQFDLEYGINDIIGDTYVNYKIFDGHLCQEGNNDITGNNTYLASRLRPDFQPIGDGNGNRTVKVTLNIDPLTIPQTDIYFDYETYAEVKFCVRFGIYNMDYLDAEALEVNFLETPVLLTINLVDDFALDFGQFGNMALVIELANQDSAVEAYICDSDSNVIETEVKAQGETVRVCVVPTEQTTAEGAYLRHIEEFTFTQGDLSQVAISPGTEGAPADGLTVVSCTSGSEICAFETLLGAEFFYEGIGIVQGTGTAFLQIGTESVYRSRKLTLLTPEEATLAKKRRRSLQASTKEEAQLALAERPTGFGIDIVATPGEEEETVSATKGTFSCTCTCICLLVVQVVMAATTLFV